MKKLALGITALMGMVAIHGQKEAFDNYVYRSRGKGCGLPQHCPNHRGKPGKNYPHHSARQASRTLRRLLRTTPL